MMRNTLWSRALLVAVVAAVSITAQGAGGVRTSLADSVQVQIMQTCTGGVYGGCTYAFSPSQVTVPAGSTITWVNGTNTSHTASADAGAFDTGTISMGSQESATLKTPGTYSYHCDFHPYMMASIVVTGAAATATSIPPTTAPSSTSVPPTAAPFSTSTSTPPAATATLQPSPVPSDTVTTQPALSLSASLAPKNVHPGGKLQLSIRTRPRSSLDMTITRPGARSVHHHARAKSNGTYQTTITIGKGARHGTLTVKITAKLGAKAARAVARSSIT